MAKNEGHLKCWGLSSSSLLGPGDDQNDGDSVKISRGILDQSPRPNPAAWSARAIAFSLPRAGWLTIIDCCSADLPSFLMRISCCLLSILNDCGSVSC